jgi:FkbM family methyltransferase
MQPKESLLKKIYKSIPFKRQVFEGLRSVYVPSKSIYRHLFFDGKFKVKVENDKSFYINHYNTHGFIIEDGLFWVGLGVGREGYSLRLWTTLSKSSTVVFDIGANTGMYSLLTKSVNPNAEVFGFEPVKRTHDKYKANCDLNKYDVKAEWMAVSDFTGELTLYDIPEANNYSATLNKEFSDVRHVSHKDTRFEAKVKATTLKDYIEVNNITHIDLMKIDVEMHEPEALRGMGEYLQKFQPTLLIEIFTDTLGKQVQDILQGCDYLFYSIDEDGTTTLQQNIIATDESNYLICRPEVAKKLGLFNQ